MDVHRVGYVAMGDQLDPSITSMSAKPCGPRRGHGPLGLGRALGQVEQKAVEVLAVVPSTT